MKEYTIVYDEKNHERKYIRYEAGIPIILSKDIVIDECNKEIERLKSNEKTLADLLDKEQKKNKKAIEYIEIGLANEEEAEELLNILKGDDK